MSDGTRKMVGGVLISCAVLVAGAHVKDFMQRRRNVSLAAKLGADPAATSRVLGAITRRTGPLFDSPLYKAYVAKLKAANAGGSEKEAGNVPQVSQVLTARGAPRLPDQELATLHELKNKMILASPRACACFWFSSTCSEGDVFDGLSRLADPDLDTWASLVAAAMEVELAASNPVPPTISDLQKGLEVMRARLPPEQRDRFVAILEPTDPKAPVSRADECFAAKTLYSGHELLDPEDRPRFIRALAHFGVD